MKARLYLHPKLFDIFDPLGSLSDEFVKVFAWISKILEKILLDPRADLTQADSVLQFQEGQDNLALYIAYAMFGLVVIFGIFLLSGKKIVEGLVIWMIVVALVPQWVDIVISMRDSSFDLAEAVSFYEPKGNQSDPFDDFDNPIITIYFAFWALIWGGAFAALITSYELVIVFFMAWFMVALAVSMIGPRARKVASAIWSLGLVATLFGRPAAVFFNDAGQWATDTLPFGATGFGAGVFTIGSWALGILFQGVLLFTLYHVANQVQGRIAAAVKGAVISTIRHTVKVDLKKASGGSLRPMPVTIVPSQGGSFGQTVKQEGTRKAKKLAYDGAAIAVASVATPAAGGAVKAYGDYKTRPPAKTA